MNRGLLICLSFAFFVAFTLAVEINSSQYSNLSQEEIDALLVENNMSAEEISTYLTENKELINEINPEDVVSMISCNMMVQFFADDLVGKEIPEEVPFSDELVSIYLDDVLLGRIIIENKYVKEYSCDAGDSTYFINVSSSIYDDIDALYIDAKNNGWNVEKIIDLYKAKKASGELVIKGTSFGRNFKLFLINIGISVAKWFL